MAADHAGGEGPTRMTPRARRDMWIAVAVGVVMVTVMVVVLLWSYSAYRQLGDLQRANNVLVSSMLVLGLLVLVVMGTLTAGYWGQVRTAALTRRFPDKVVVTVVNPSRLPMNVTKRIPSFPYYGRTLSFTLVADAEGLSLWYGLPFYRRSTAISWSSVQSLVEKSAPSPDLVGRTVSWIQITTSTWPNTLNLSLTVSIWTFHPLAPAEDVTHLLDRLALLRRT